MSTSLLVKGQIGQFTGEVNFLEKFYINLGLNPNCQLP